MAPNRAVAGAVGRRGVGRSRVRLPPPIVGAHGTRVGCRPTLEDGATREDNLSDEPASVGCEPRRISSLPAGGTPEDMMAVGRALAPLRAAGFMIVGRSNAINLINPINRTNLRYDPSHWSDLLGRMRRACPSLHADSSPRFSSLCPPWRPLRRRARASRSAASPSPSPRSRRLDYRPGNPVSFHIDVLPRRTPGAGRDRQVRRRPRDAASRHRGDGGHWRHAAQRVGRDDDEPGVSAARRDGRDRGAHLSWRRHGGLFARSD